MKFIRLSNIDIELIQKDIKNIHLSVNPPEGNVRISAPLHTDPETLRMFALSKLNWIKKQITKFKNQARESKREYVSRETHYVFGKKYLLKIKETESKSSIKLTKQNIELNLKNICSLESKQNLIKHLYREQLTQVALNMIDKWEQELKLKNEFLKIRKMRTRWGSSNPDKKQIILNLELAKKNKRCIEYVVLHELLHFKFRNHDERFIAYLDKYMPDWKSRKKQLNNSMIVY